MNNLFTSLIKELEKMTPEQFDKEYKEITHEKFWKRWVEKVNKLDKDNRINIIYKLINKYSSNKYIENEYSRGYEPRKELFDLILRYAEKYGESIYEKYNDLGYNLDFCTELYYIDNTFIIELLCGQGSIINVFTVNEYEKLTKHNYGS